MLKGVRAGRDTLHLNIARASSEMFTKVDCTEIQPSSPGEGTHPENRWRKGGGDEEHRHEMAEGSAGDSMLFFDYAAPAFAHLRGVYGMSASEYRRSFREGSEMIALASNSKSAQSFMFSEDGKYMLKTASESELDSMLRLLPRYAEHVARRRGSLITRFYGIYRVSNPSTGRSTVFVSSSNVFSTEKRLHERYDLKGSVVGRRTLPARSTAVAKPTTMLKDLDLSESSADCKKIRLAAGCKKRLMAELRADADFLSGLGLMDYSLLVGIHHPNKVSPSKVKSKVLAIPLALLSAASKPVWATGCYVLGLLPGGARRGGRRPQVGVYPGREPGVVYYMGIIDVLQRYNLKKILERGAKGVVYNRHELSAVPPAEYRDRFIDFIDRSTE
ncbi:unnamed protein product [Scytosiphon promiscuus]